VGEEEEAGFVEGAETPALGCCGGGWGFCRRLGGWVDG